MNTLRRRRHTVRPRDGAGADTAPTPAPSRGPYGSWCTPKATPTHAALPPTTDSKAQPDDSAKRNIFHKARIFPDPSPDYSRIEEFKEEPTELKDIKADRDEDFSGQENIFEVHNSRIFLDSSPDYSRIEEFNEEPTELKDIKAAHDEDISAQEELSEKSPIPPVESPQSPVPSSPAREKCKGLRLPFCDPFLPIDPQGRGYISWLHLATFCYSYNAWCIVLRATFPYQTPENTPIWMTMDYFCDLVYLIDLALVKPRLMYLHEGFWVNDPVETRRNYRTKMQFKFDVLSLAPLDLLYIFFGTKWVILRFPRLLKLQTFWEFHQALDRVLSSPYIVRIGKMLFYIFYLIHLNACAYYAMSAYIGLGSNGWVYDNQGNAYIRCFYFATKTATSIGKNPKPEKTEEYLFMTAAWLMGVFVFAILIGQIRDIIATATRARAEYRKQADGCAAYLRRLNMPSALRRRVAAWFTYTWSQQRCFDEARILDSLPINMKRDVALAVHITTLSKVQLFKDCSDSLLRDLVLQLRPVSFLPGDIVVREGDVGHQMYIIKSGECCVMSHDENEVLATLKEGSVFGEISLLGIEGLRRRTATVRSRGYSSLFALSRNDLNAALKHHKEAAQVLRLRADQIIRQNAARQAKERIQAHEARKSANLLDAAAAKHRRLSSASSGDSSMTMGRRRRSASAQSWRKLSVVSEDKLCVATVTRPRPSLESGCSGGTRTPLPSIVLNGTEPHTIPHERY